MKNLLTLLIAFIWFGAYGQIKQVVYSNNAQPGTSEYIVLDVIQTADLGYLVLTGSDGQPRIEVTKLDANGDIVWQEGYLTQAEPSGGQIQQHSNGDIIVAISSLSLYMRVFYLDNLGQYQWNRRYYIGSDLGVSDQVGVVVDHTSPTPEYILYAALGSTTEPYLIRIDDNGTTLWQYRYEHIWGPGPLDNVTIQDMIVASTGNIFAVATSSGSQFIMKFSNNGSFQELYTTNYVLNDLVEIPGGDILAVGSVPDVYGNHDAAYLLFDANTMNEIENGSFGSSNYETATSVTVNADNSWSLGVLDNSTGDTKMAIYKLNGANNLDWSRAYGGSDTDSPKGIFQKADGGWTIIGTTASFSPTRDMMIVMTDDQGTTTGCQEDLTYTITSNNSFNYSDFFGGTAYVSGLTIVGASISPVYVEADTIQPYPITSIVGIDPLCYGGNGSIDLTVTDGVVPYYYTWSNGTSAQDIGAAADGTYTVILEDANGCQVHDTITLTEPSQMSSSETHVDITCTGASDGSIDLSVSGGTPGYSYLWSYNGLTTQDITGIPGGFYQVTITDNNGCQINQFVSVNEPTALTAAISGITDISCHDLCDGQIDGIVSGGTMPYSYLWNDQSNQTTTTATNLCEGTYLFTVTDNNGCTAISSASVQNPDELLGSVATTPTECGLNEGGGVATPIGGTAPYAYSWPLGSSTNEDSLYGLGAYTMQIIDANGCSIDVDFEILPFVIPVDICLITVDSTSSFNEVVWEKPVADNIAGYKVYRNVAGSYDEIGYVPYANLSVFQDQTFGVDPNVTSYRYKVSAVDTCGNESDLSDFHETIHLTATEGIGGEINLIWDNYEGFSFVNYNILKDTTDNGITDWYVADQVSNISFSWTDLNPETYTNYAIQVIPTDPCTATNKAQDYNSSRSNNSSAIAGEPGASIEEENSIYSLDLFPNPNNGQFNLKVGVTESENYDLTIYNLQGQLIYQDIIYLSAGNQIIQFDHMDLLSGIYVLHLNSNDQNEQIRFSVLNH